MPTATSRRAMRISSFTLAISIVLANINPIAAQELHGAITGKVTDPEDAVIPAASVTVTNAETGAVSRTRTDQAGYFEVNLLNPGHYTITVEAAGFKKLTRSGLELEVSGRLDVALALQVGQVDDLTRA